MNDTTSARLMASIHVYEKVKLTLLIVTVLLDLAIGVFLINGQSTQQGSLHSATRTLVILTCAVDKNTQFTPQGRPRTPQDARVVFDQCVAAARRGK